MLRINKNVIFRFEKNIENGVLFIYNAESGCIVKSTEVVYKLLKLIQKEEMDRDQLLNIVKSYTDNNVSQNEITMALERLFTELLKKRILDSDEDFSSSNFRPSIKMDKSANFICYNYCGDIKSNLLSSNRSCIYVDKHLLRDYHD